MAQKRPTIGPTGKGIGPHSRTEILQTVPEYRRLRRRLAREMGGIRSMSYRRKQMFDVACVLGYRLQLAESEIILCTETPETLKRYQSWVNRFRDYLDALGIKEEPVREESLAEYLGRAA